MEGKTLDFYQGRVRKMVDAKPPKTHIRVFITSTGKFRAHIDEPGKPNYEVTINGKSWKEGKGQKHKERIREKIINILHDLQVELATINEE